MPAAAGPAEGAVDPDAFAAQLGGGVVNTIADLQDFAKSTARGLGIDPDLFTRLIHQESRWRPEAVSPKGARGLTQLMPGTAAELGVDPSNPQQAIVGGARYLKQQLTKYKGDVRKALAAYNAGPGAVDQYGGVPPFAETQGYVAAILGDDEQQAGATPPPQAAGVDPDQFARQLGGTTTTPALPAAAKTGMLPPDTRVSYYDTTTPPPAPPPTIANTLMDFAGGLRAGVARTIFQGGDLIRRATGMERIVDEPDVVAAMTPPSSTAGKVGKFVEDVAEFAIPATKITKAPALARAGSKLIAAGVSPTRVKLILGGLEGVAQGSAAAGLTAVHGDEGALSAGVLNAAFPAGGAVLTTLGPAIKTVAVAQMAKVLEKGQKGDITPRLQAILHGAASDALKLPLYRTWMGLKASTRGSRETAGKTLEQALGGPAGRARVPTAPVISALDDLVASSAQHLVQARGGYTKATYDPGLVSAVDSLKDVLGQYGADLPAAQLHDIKKVWDAAVFPKREAGQPIASIGELLTTAQKTARLTGANAIRDALDVYAPTISSLDEAVSHAIKLDQIVKRLAVKAPKTTSPAARLAQAGGGAVGAAGGAMAGHPFLGAHLGYATTRVLQEALSSPLWRMAGPTLKGRLADALQAGKADTVRKLVAPFITPSVANPDDIRNAGKPPEDVQP